MDRQAPPHIGTLNEKPLHAALKAWYAKPGDEMEVAREGFIIDIVRGDLLIEIQTRSFSSLRQKLARLLVKHPVRLVYPIASEKWIIKQARDSRRLSRRKSPKRGRLEHIFEELVSIPGFLAKPNFSLDVLLIQEEEIRHQDASVRAWRRRGWAVQQRRLVQVVDQQLFETPADLAALLPLHLPTPFTTADLAAALDCPRRLAQQMAYCLRKLRLILPAGKEGNTILYKLCNGKKGNERV
jgi:hypothetical protein